MHESGRRARALDVLVHPPAAFLRNYLLRRGCLDGSVGLTLSLVNAYSVFLKFVKLWDLQRTTRTQPAVESRTPNHGDAETPSAERERVEYEPRGR
jgi:hypothetical protein